MIKRLLALVCAILMAVTALAQNYKITLKLQDASTGEPVGFATVSATPEKGQAKYSLSDHDGNATLEKIRPGKYTLKAELLGYQNYEKPLEVKADTDLGVIKMEVDRQTLDAASVSATGNPIIVK